jgi:hypothetical protein
MLKKEFESKLDKSQEKSGACWTQALHYRGKQINESKEMLKKWLNNKLTFTRMVKK